MYVLSSETMILSLIIHISLASSTAVIISNIHLSQLSQTGPMKTDFHIRDAKLVPRYLVPAALAHQHLRRQPPGRAPHIRPLPGMKAQLHLQMIPNYPP